jgi:lipoate-protein ligase B
VRFPGKTCYALFLGTIDYAAALQLQMQVCRLKKRSLQEDVLLLLEHPPTITLGRNGTWRHLLARDESLASRGVRCYEADRGGDITFHGPGQLVGYPILRLEGGERDVHLYMRRLEEVLIRVLSCFGIEGSRREGLTGVWTGPKKIAALGVHISRWITRHGFALNVQTDLSFFDLILPCGIAGLEAASMSSALRRTVEVSDVANRLGGEFGEVLGRNLVWLSENELREILEGHARESEVA